MPRALLPFSHTCLPAATAGWDSYSLWATGLLRLLLLLLPPPSCYPQLTSVCLIFISLLSLSPTASISLPGKPYYSLLRLCVCVCVRASLMVNLCVLTLARIQFMSFIMWPRTLSGERVCACRTMSFRVSIFHKQLHCRDDE